jgi:hypothetical protein
MGALTIAIVSNIVLGGVLFGLLYRRRGNDTERLTGPEQALARYRIRYPRASGRVSLSADGRSALLALTDGSVGLIERCGQRWNARALEGREILGVERVGDGAIVVRFADFGWPRSRVQLADPETCRSWIERLAAMRAAAVAAPGPRVHRA